MRNIAMEQELSRMVAHGVISHVNDRTIEGEQTRQLMLRNAIDWVKRNGWMLAGATAAISFAAILRS